MLDKLDDYEHYKLLSELVERYINQLDYYNNIDKDTIYSNVISKNWDKLNDGSIKNIEAYLYTATKNAIIDEKKKEAKLVQFDNDIAKLSYTEDHTQMDTEKLYNTIYRLIDLMIANDTTIKNESNKQKLKDICYNVIDNRLNYQTQVYKFKNNLPMVKLYKKIFLAIHDLLII